MNKKLSKIDKIMIISHPDDEIFWGYESLINETGWKIICLTNGNNDFRRKSFIKVMEALNAQYEIWNHTDSYRIPFSEKEKKEISKKLNEHINHPKIKKVVTHSPNGEYGHISHIQISKMVTNIILNKELLYFFCFKADKKPKLDLKKLKLISIYFPHFNKAKYRLLYNQFFQDERKNNISFVDLIRIELFKKKLYSIFIKLKTKLTNFLLRDEDSRDYLHYLASECFTIVQANSYKNEESLLKKIYGNNYLPRNATEVYLNKKNVYDKYIDRKFLVTEYLPKAVGKTLSVGCHYINLNDCYCLPNPQDYKTIDLHKENEIFGSPYGHKTIDFLDYDPKYLFSNIILFGVLGIKTLKGSEMYTLLNKEYETIAHADKLLEVKGKILFGPDIFIDKTKERIKKISFWKKFFNNNKILKEKYKLQNLMEFERNLIFIFEKEFN